MQKSQISLMLALKELERPFEISTFTKRLVLQKTVYIVQKSGLDLGYYFKWYHHGPYASELASDAFAIDPNSSFKQWSLDGNAISLLGKIKSFFDIETDNLADRLELSASILFILDNDSCKKDDPKTIFDFLYKRGKDKFTLSDVQSSLSEITKYSLV